MDYTSKVMTKLALKICGQRSGVQFSDFQEMTGSDIFCTCEISKNSVICSIFGIVSGSWRRHERNDFGSFE